MLAETFLSAVIQKLADLLYEEAKSLIGNDSEQVKSLQKELEIIEPLLRDAEAKYARGQLSEASKVWLRHLREEAERIEDVLDEYTYNAEERRQESVVKSIFGVGRSFKRKRGLSSKIGDIKESLRQIKENGLSYGLRPFEQGGSSAGDGSSRVDPRIGSLFVEDDELVGIESDVAELMSNLVEGTSQRRVVSLVGEGGIGKTTLARKVYNDVVEKGCFDTHVWVTVSQSYDIDKILKTLMTRICPAGGGTTTHEEVFTLLRSSLREKRYVVVFDDVWQTDFWSVIKHVFPNSSNGSRILLTTRNSMVVESFKSPSSCEMFVKVLKTWSSEQAWKLFCKNAFPDSDSRCPPELERLSDTIMKKCQGLPLAIVAVAGLLSKKEKLEVEWQKVLDRLSYEFEENNGLSNVSKILRLSYYDLPYHLKLCFMYFAAYPEDFEILGYKLYTIWAAEGFIRVRKDKTLEEIAEEYLMDLISRSLVSSKIQLGGERVCWVHDLIREVIQERARNLCYCKLFNQKESNFNERGRRLIIYDSAENVLSNICNSTIRSVVLVNIVELPNSCVVGLFKNCKLLKVVDFEGASLYDLPKEVGNLLHLKYFNLRGTKVKTLPKSIGKLYNLQTLNVSFTSVQELPVEINKLKRLRHIFAYTFDAESEYSIQSRRGVRMHEGFGSLEELQSLCLLDMQLSKVNLVNELQRMSKLKNLSISKVSAKMCEILGKCIEKMNDLERLNLFSINKDEVLDLNFIRSPPLLLRFCGLYGLLRQLPVWVSELHNLQGLQLNFSRLVDEPLNYLKGLSSLTDLCLYEAYDGEELQFEKGSFMKLKKLELRHLEGLKVVKIERGALPVLEVLRFGSSPLMKEMPSDLQHLTNLKSLQVFDMPREFVKTLQPNGGSEYSKIQHISSVTFWYYTGKGDIYDWYKLGSSGLLQRLEEQYQWKRTVQSKGSSDYCVMKYAINMLSSD